MRKQNFGASLHTQKSKFLLTLLDDYIEKDKCCISKVKSGWKVLTKHVNEIIFTFFTRFDFCSNIQKLQWSGKTVMQPYSYTIVVKHYLLTV